MIRPFDLILSHDLSDSAGWPSIARQMPQTLKATTLAAAGLPQHWAVARIAKESKG